MEIKPGIHWIGAIDWNLRDFHGYVTQRGSTYNSYLILDEKKVVVDTVKKHLAKEWLANIERLVDFDQIDYIVSNHVEMDHSGSLPVLMELAPQAKIITSVHGERGLKRHYKKEWDFKTVQSNSSMNIGKRTLTFVHTAMVHWPDNMVTYIAEDKLLLPNDAFGQHIAHSQRFDNDVGWDIIREEAAKYYANIVLPYGLQVQKAIEALGTLDIDMIAPSHGQIWRTYIPKLLEEYHKWANNICQDKALVVYDTMWGSTEKMAHAIKDGLIEAKIPTTVRSLKHSHHSDIMTDVLDSKLLIFGSPTINNGMLPSMGGFLTYLKGLKPQNRVGFAFGSYGWGGQATGQIEEEMKTLKWEVPIPSVRHQYIPDDEELINIKNTAMKLAESIK
ncbi:MAG TPA: FprA family A-type flavoprotein [Euryarchaeota archaeon]|nr:FprA family A-type flavoprotein [Euryarchaeota archaeon]